MVASNYSLLSAFIFTLVAVPQLVRALNGWPVTVGTTSIPYGQVGLPALLPRSLPGLDLRRLRSEK